MTSEDIRDIVNRLNRELNQKPGAKKKLAPGDLQLPPCPKCGGDLVLRDGLMRCLLSNRGCGEYREGSESVPPAYVPGVEGKNIKVPIKAAASPGSGKKLQTFSPLLFVGPKAYNN